MIFSESYTLVSGCFVAWHIPPQMVTDRTAAPTDKEEVHTSSKCAQILPPCQTSEGMPSVQESVEAILATSSRFSIEPSLGTGTGSEVVGIVREGMNAFRVTTRDGCQQVLDEAALNQLPQGVARLATLRTREFMAARSANKYQSAHKDAGLDNSSTGQNTDGTAKTQECVVFVFGFSTLAQCLNVVIELRRPCKL